jgi:hypothetical protein
VHFLGSTLHAVAKGSMWLFEEGGSFPFVSFHNLICISIPILKLEMPIFTTHEETLWHDANVP